LGYYICPETSNIVSKQFDDYEMMSIGTQTESFFRIFYRLDKAERKLLDRSCKLVFDMLLVGFRMEIKKNKSKMAKVISCLGIFEYFVSP